MRLHYNFRLAHLFTEISLFFEHNIFGHSGSG